MSDESDFLTVLRRVYGERPFKAVDVARDIVLRELPPRLWRARQVKRDPSLSIGRYLSTMAGVEVAEESRHGRLYRVSES
jgi:hypothetical protein